MIIDAQDYQDKFVDAENYLAHYGILRKSGRYPWGSGNTQNARNQSFLDAVEALKRNGVSEPKIAEGFGMTTTQLRALKTIALSQQKQDRINEAQKLREKGLSNGAIAKRMGLANESSVRSLLEPGQADKINILHKTADMLRREVDEKKYVDIGAGVEMDLPLSGNPAARIGISSTKFNTAVAMLREEGYEVHSVPVPQQGTGKNTNVKVLAKPGTEWKEVAQNKGEIRQINEHSEDGGRSYLGLQDPMSISSKRVAVRYADDGGADADGVIYVRPGAKDLSMGSSRYAQVRIKIDGTHYLKGMAVLKDDLPDGADLVFNTNKKDTGNKKDAMKPLKDDPDNPFGASISRQITNEKGKLSSAMNIVNDAGDWDKWSKSLPSQMLSKQSPDLARSQLDLTYDRRRSELDTIMGLTNPAVRKKLLDSYADDVDSAAVHLKAAHLPRQATRVLLPVNSVKANEIYATGFRDGERVALVRYPHGGTFEIPELTVNNRNKEARKLLGGSPKDAVAINPRVAERLSGADFDGDSVVVIPNNRGLIKSTPALEGLKNFDPRSAYPPHDGLRTIDGGVYNAKTRSVDYGGRPPKAATMQQEMGKITNLIADMTVRGAPTPDLARAVRHSMVVIDSEKHHLDYKASAKANGIPQLKAKYQKEAGGSKQGGASTLITRATSEIRVPDRKARSAKDGGPVDKATGKLAFVETGATYTDRNGRVVKRTIKSQKLAETDDAHTLSSGTTIERVYANHSNRLKALANTARKESVFTRPTPYSPSAKKAYATEVSSLDHKLNTALRNRPLERQAQIIAGKTVMLKRQQNPNMDGAELKKIRAQALREARIRTGAGKKRVIITQREWNAIQAGAISNNKLVSILNNSDIDEVKKLAMPRVNPVMTASKQAKAKSLLSAGYTQAEVADALGVPVSTLTSSIGL